MKNKRFDIETFNKNNKDGTYEYTQDSAVIIHERWKEEYVEYVRPVGKFYNILNVYYLNGNLKEHGIRLNSGSKIKTWEFYDEQGNLVQTIDEEAKFRKVPFDYNQVFLWLDKRGYISIEKGVTNASFSISFDSEKKTWHIDVHSDRKSYTIDGRSGRIIDVEDMWVVY